jgi:hypothetical protein
VKRQVRNTCVFIYQNLELSNGSLMTVSGERVGGDVGPSPMAIISQPSPRPPPVAAAAPSSFEDRPVGGGGRSFAQLMSEKVKSLHVCGNAMVS